MANETTENLTELTVELLSAFVANNNVRTDDLPALIASTHAALSALATSGSAAETTVASVEPTYQPAVTARKSLADREVIISLIDGKPYKTLKRHLTGHGLTPEAYRARYNLPATYPMVAPGYSEARSEVAKRLGLGRKPQVQEEPAVEKRARKPRVAKQPPKGPDAE